MTRTQRHALTTLQRCGLATFRTLARKPTRLALIRDRLITPSGKLTRLAEIKLGAKDEWSFE